MKLIKFTSLFLFTAALTNCSSDRDDRPTPIDPVVPEKRYLASPITTAIKLMILRFTEGLKA